jgi:DNA-directed RNA polymerase specialized sigma24 family protein
MLAREACGAAALMATQPKSEQLSSQQRGELLDQLLKEHGAKLRAQTRRNSQLPSDADDALQDACVAFLRFYDGPGGLDALRWMQLVSKRCAWVIGRRGHRQRERSFGLPGEDRPDASPADDFELFLADPGRGPAELAEDADTARERRRRFAQLKPDERRALLLFALGYSYGEIAERCGWTYTKVNRCINEGRATLRASAKGES